MIRSWHIVLAFIIFLTAVIFFNIRPYLDFATKTLGISPVNVVLKNTSLLKPVNDSIGMLILGIPGAPYDGPYLSDTLIAVHVNLKTNHVTLISLPRDIWSPAIKEKINAAYAIGRAKRKDGGLILAKAEIGAIVGFPIDYGTAITFNTFEKLIDTLGGVDVKVEKSFTDDEFPVPGKADDPCNGDPEYKCRYMSVSFDAGEQHMDGKKALIFARSRHAVGSEGSDFARAKRQQIIIQAMKDKILEVVKKRDMNKLSEIYATLDTTIERDITNEQLAALTFHIVKSGSFEHTSTRLPPELFKVPPLYEYEGRYVLVPKGGSYNQIHSSVECLLEKHDEKTCFNGD